MSLNLAGVSQYANSSIGPGFGGTTGFGAPNFNPAPLGTGFPSYSQGGGSSSGGFFDNFQLKDAMPFAAAGIGGLLSDRTASNYGQSMLAAQNLQKDVGLFNTMTQLQANKDMARFGLSLDQQAKERELRFQMGAPFQNLLTARAGMGETGAGWEDRAAKRAGYGAGGLFTRGYA